MNKYYLMLQNILENGREQRNKKGIIRYLTNEVMRMDAGDLLDIFESHGIARKKLKSELELFCRGERNTEAYREAGISWWDYCGPILVNSYPFEGAKVFRQHVRGQALNYDDMMLVNAA